MSNQPKLKINASPITAIIWENKKEFNGKETSFHTISIERTYKDKEDQWQKTNSFRESDLPKVVAVAQRAFEYLNIKVTVGEKTNNEEETPDVVEEKVD